MALVLLQVVWQFALVAIEGVVDESETGTPVTVLRLTVALNIVLSSGKVLHEVATVHEVALVREEEADVVKL